MTTERAVHTCSFIGRPHVYIAACILKMIQHWVINNKYVLFQ